MDTLIRFFICPMILSLPVSLYAVVNSKFCMIFCPSRSKMAIQEVGQFQNRLNRNMGECQEKARDLMTPGFENDARKTAKVENALINCMAKTVDEHIALLNPMKDRIIASFKQFK